MRPEVFDLEAILLLEPEDFDDALEGVVNFKGPHAVFAVVAPKALLVHAFRPFLGT